MPRIPVDYSNTVFYKIVCSDLNIQDCYAGHTTNFKKRKNIHKHTCNNPNVENYNMPVYCFIRENGGWENWKMVMIETQNLNSKLEAEKREWELIIQGGGTLNKHKPYRTKKEEKEYKAKWHVEHQDEVKQRCKKFYEDHRQEILQQRKMQIVCGCGSTFRQADVRRHERTKKHQDYLKTLEPVD